MQTVYIYETYSVVVRVWSPFLTHLRAEVACLQSADGDVVAQRRGSEEEFMENTDATSGQIFTMDMDRPDIDKSLRQ